MLTDRRLVKDFGSVDNFRGCKLSPTAKLVVLIVQSEKMVTYQDLVKRWCFRPDEASTAMHELRAASQTRGALGSKLEFLRYAESGNGLPRRVYLEKVPRARKIEEVEE